jgi:hypothetical protein
MSTEEIDDVDDIEEDELPEGVELEAPEPTSPQAIAFRNTLMVAVEELVKGEHIEVAEGQNELLANELLLAAQEAHNPRHALKKLRLGLIHSDHTEEVYSADHVIEDAFRKALGG